MPLPADGPDLGSPDTARPSAPAKPQNANLTKPADAAIALLPPINSTAAGSSFTRLPSPPMTLPPVARPAAIASLLPPQPVAPPLRIDELNAVSRQANSQTAHGFQLGSRGAVYSARADFVAALHTIADALDSAGGGNAHQRMLSDGLQTLDEADDFAPQSSGLLSDEDLARIVAGHQTLLLKTAKLDGMSRSAAMSRYLTLAQEQLAGCIAGVPAGSAALFGLGKIYSVPASMHGPADRTHGAKSVAIYQAALLADGRNYRAANELGVLLAKFGRLPEAKNALLHSVMVSPQPTTWENLSAIHRALGEQDLANRAHQEAVLAAARQNHRLGSQAIVVEWLDPTTFASTAPLNIDGTPPNRSTHQTTMTAGTQTNSVR